MIEFFDHFQPRNILLLNLALVLGKKLNIFDWHLNIWNSYFAELKLVLNRVGLGTLVLRPFDVSAH